ncbi:MAG TPA: hypothetical protein VFO27_07310, partial [Bryobacteraceae bacterium]|nr:hypothetical protein [Bryobacteraceae bacterium]
ALVEFVGSVADYVGTHIYRLTAVPSGPGFRGGQQFRTGTRATLTIRNDQAVYLGAQIAFQ